MKRVLIVSPHFPPVNAPDHQRARMALPYFREFGWDPQVLTVESGKVEGNPDPLLNETLPSDAAVTRTSAVPAGLTRLFGLGDLALRSFPFLWRAGSRLLSEAKYDLVFFTTTVFPAMALGPLWRRGYRVPYVLDFQDPWLSDYYDRPGAPAPPGGKMKFALSQLLARALEPPVVRGASHIISVSPAYRSDFLRRYPGLRPDRLTVLPFGAPERDFEILPQMGIRQRIFGRNDGKRHWVYVGRGGGDMALALRGLFQALARARLEQPSRWEDLRIHFVGTSYAPPGAHPARTVEPLAVECGVGDLVMERTERLPYLESLQCLLDAEALIVPGSDDPGYTASKIYPYVLARKPLLAVFHEQSTVVKMLRSTGAGTVVTFSSGEAPGPLASRIGEHWFSRWPVPAPATRWEAFASYSARSMTQALCRAFDGAVGGS